MKLKILGGETGREGEGEGDGGRVDSVPSGAMNCHFKRPETQGKGVRGEGERES